MKYMNFGFVAEPPNFKLFMPTDMSQLEKMAINLEISLRVETTLKLQLKDTEHN